VCESKLPAKKKFKNTNDWMFIFTSNLMKLNIAFINVHAAISDKLFGSLNQANA